MDAHATHNFKEFLPAKKKVDVPELFPVFK